MQTIQYDFRSRVCEHGALDTMRSPLKARTESAEPFKASLNIVVIGNQSKRIPSDERYSYPCARERTVTNILVLINFDAQFANNVENVCLIILMQFSANERSIFNENVSNFVVVQKSSKSVLRYYTLCLQICKHPLTYIDNQVTKLNFQLVVV